MTAVIVVGGHRAGTSCVAGVLDRLGVNMGARLLAAGPSNPLGYYEDLDLLALNRRALGEVDGAGRVVPARWRDPKVVDPCRAGYAAFAAARAAFPLWGAKDPRLCATLPLLLDALGGADVRFVHVRRPPAAAAASLFARESGADPAFTRADAAAVAARYHALALALLPALRGRGPVLSLAYPWVVADPREAVAALARFAAPGADGDMLNNAVRYVRPSLAHWPPGDTT